MTQSADSATSTPRAVMFVIVASLAFAVSGPLAKYAYPTHPAVLALGRVVVAALVLIALEPKRFFRSVSNLRLRDALAVSGTGAVLALHFLLFLWGLEQTSLPAAVALISIEPLSVVLWAWLLLRIRVSRIEQVAVALAVAGALLVGRGAGSGVHRISGDLLVLGAVLLYGVYVALARRLRHLLPPRQHAAAVFLGAAATLTLLLVVLDVGASNRVLWPLPVQGWIAIVGLGCVPTLVGHTAVQVAARTLPPAFVALVSPGETVGSLLIGALVLDAVPMPVELGGCVLIVGAVIVTALGRTRAGGGTPQEVA